MAAQTAKQVILQRLREAEREAQYAEFAEREGEMVHGTVHSITPQAVTIGLGRAEAILPRNQQIPGEHFRVRDRVRVYVLEVRKSSRGPVIIVSRTHPNMLRRLLEMEVPEINQGMVEIKAIAREAGKRAKVAVAAMADGVDPVGACVGLRGVRIQSIVRDLNDEKIDVIEWNADPATFIAKALSPARVSGVYLDEDPDHGKTAMVVVPEDQLSLAIGHAGVNARLGARLTGWRIDIKSLPEAASESLNLLQSDETYAEMGAKETDTMVKVESIMAKKAEGRPIAPEDYQILNGFVDRVQGEGQARRNAKRQAYVEALAEVRADIPAGAYFTGLADSGLSTRVINLLTEGGFKTAGQVLEQLAIDEKAIRKLPGVGPKAIEEIRDTLKGRTYEVPPEPVVAEAEAPAEGAVTEAVEVEALPTAETAVEASAVQAEVLGEPAAGAEALPAAEGEAAAPTGIEGEEKVVDIEKVFEELQKSLVTGAAIPAGAEIEDLDDEDDDDNSQDKEKNKARRRVVEFDPETGEVVVRRRHKGGRGTDEWEEGGF